MEAKYGGLFHLQPDIQRDTHQDIESRNGIRQPHAEKPPCSSKTGFEDHDQGTNKPMLLNLDEARVEAALAVGTCSATYTAAPPYLPPAQALQNSDGKQCDWREPARRGVRRKKPIRAVAPPMMLASQERRTCDRQDHQSDRRTMHRTTYRKPTAKVTSTR